MKLHTLSPAPGSKKAPREKDAVQVLVLEKLLVVDKMDKNLVLAVVYDRVSKVDKCHWRVAYQNAVFQTHDSKKHLQ